MTALALATVDTFEGDVWCYDAETFVRSLPTESVDLVVTSPPYNFRNTTGGWFSSGGKGSIWSAAALRNGYDVHGDNLPHDVYIAWQRRVLRECMRVLKPTGAIFYNHKWRVQAGLRQDLPGAITDGLPLRQIIIWDRSSGYNWNDGYFVPTYEVIYVITKPAFKLQPGTNTYGDVWRVNPDQDNGHPAPFPLEIPRRCIEAGCPADGIVLDPFAGSGTTLVAARNLGRHYIGCDISAEYVALAQKRLAKPYDVPLFAADARDDAA